MGVAMSRYIYVLELWRAWHLLCVSVLSTLFYIVLYDLCHKPLSYIPTHYADEELIVGD